MGETTPEETREKLGNIDQIRDIIFGAQVREYNARLERLESDLSGLQQDTRDRLEQLRASLSLELRHGIEGLEKKLRSHSTAAQEEGDDLKQQIDRLNRRISNSTRDLDAALDQQTHALQRDLSQTRDRLQGNLSSLRDLVLEEIDRRFAALGETKVSRDDFAETLFELGLRLKGTEVAPRLREAADGPPLLEEELKSNGNGSN